jgi:hypothetical protein
MWGKDNKIKKIVYRKIGVGAITQLYFVKADVFRIHCSFKAIIFHDD